MAVKKKKIATKAKPKIGRPKKEEGVSVRENLIFAGAELLKKQSLETLSLRKVASLAGVSHVATYHHFESKNALLAAIAEKGFEEFFLSYEKELELTGDDFEGRFFSLGWTYIQFTLKNPQYARIMFGGSSLNFEKYPELRVVSRRTYRQLRQLIHLGQDLSRITRGESREKTLAAWSVIHGVAMLFLEGRIKPGRNRKEVKEFVRSITKYVYLGMKL